MLAVIKINWNEALSIIGAAAWLPIIITPILHLFNKIHITVLTVGLVINTTVQPLYQHELKSGSCIMLAVNLFIKNTTFYAEKIEAVVTLKNGNSYNGEITDFSTIVYFENTIKTKRIDIPIEHEINVSRTIFSGCDNIKCMALFVERGKINDPTDIEKIKITFKSKRGIGIFSSKSVTIQKSDFPKLNSSLFFRDSKV